MIPPPDNYFTDARTFHDLEDVSRLMSFCTGKNVLKENERFAYVSQLAGTPAFVSHFSRLQVEVWRRLGYNINTGSLEDGGPFLEKINDRSYPTSDCALAVDTRDVFASSKGFPIQKGGGKRGAKSKTAKDSSDTALKGKEVAKKRKTKKAKAKDGSEETDGVQESEEAKDSDETKGVKEVEKTKESKETVKSKETKDCKEKPVKRKYCRRTSKNATGADKIRLQIVGEQKRKVISDTSTNSDECKQNDYRSRAINILKYENKKEGTELSEDAIEAQIQKLKFGDEAIKATVRKERQVKRTKEPKKKKPKTEHKAEDLLSTTATLPFEGLLCTNLCNPLTRPKNPSGHPKEYPFNCLECQTIRTQMDQKAPLPVIPICNIEGGKTEL